MTASQTISTIAYTDVAPAKGSTKSYTDNSSKFEDIFNSVNKSYDTSVSADTSAVNNSKAASAKVSDNKVDDNQNSHKNDSQSVNNKEESTNKTNSKEQTKTPQEAKANNQDQEHTTQASDTKKAPKDNDNKDDKDNNQKENNEKQAASSSEETSSQDNKAPTVDNSAAASALLKDIDTSAQAPADAKAQTPADKQSQDQPAQQAADASGVDVTKVAQDLNDIVQNQTNQVNVQTQTQQVLSDVKIDPDENKKQTADDKNAAEQTNVKTPVIAATTEAIASASNIKTADADKSQNLNDVMAKASLTQGVIDKTNAKVVSVETSNSNNLLNKQNPEEQTIKLALEANSNRTTNLVDSAVQSNFAKTLDSVQSEAPKELSKTDVMSQIHSQLDKLQDETTTKVTIVLKPENLGKINLELTSGKDGITARMTTDSAQVKELLDKNIDGLKNSLGNQGVNVNNVTVKVAEASKPSDSNMFSFNDQAGKGNQQQSDNTNSGNQNQSSFNEGIDGAVTTEELSEIDSESENLALAGSHSGQVDYKV